MNTTWAWHLFPHSPSASMTVSLDGAIVTQHIFAYISVDISKPAAMLVQNSIKEDCFVEMSLEANEYKDVV